MKRVRFYNTDHGIALNAFGSVTCSLVRFRLTSTELIHLMNIWMNL